MITVFGATGTTGAPLVDTLMAKGATVRAGADRGGAPTSPVVSMRTALVYN